MNPTDRRRASLMAQMSTLQQQLDQLVDLGDLNTYPDGAIIRAEISHAGSAPYTYVLLRQTDGNVDRWYFTGSISGGGTRWVTSDRLLEWLTTPGRVIHSWQLMIPSSVKDRIHAENAAGETVVDE